MLLQFPRPCLRMPHITAFVVLLLSLSVASVGEPAPAGKSAIDQINAAIKAKGARWIARPTSATSTARGQRCGWTRDDESTVYATQSSYDLPLPSVDSLPASFDWRTHVGHNWTTHIQDQGGCGSCYVFAACAVSEGAMKVQGGVNGWQANPDFSEQFLMSCAGFSCAGGSTTGVYNYLVSTGAPPDTCFPYTANDDQPCSDRCVDWQSRIVRITGWGRVGNTDTPTIEQIKQAIVVYGPVSTGFDVYTDFKSYAGGVYEHTWGELEDGHAVAIVGWDDSQRCWIAKNSWGTNWGETIDFQPFTPGAGDGGWFRITWDDEWFGKYAKYAIASPSNLTDTAPSGWAYSVVPRSTSGASPASCPLTATLPAEVGSTYLNFAITNTAGPQAPAFAVDSTIDGETVLSTRVDPVAYGAVSCSNNLGPVPVGGGRHTVGILIDSLDEVPETDESSTESPYDNLACRQFVWSPWPISPGSALLWSKPPVKDAWGDAPTPVYENCDGFGFDVAPNVWAAVGILSTDSASNYNLRLWAAGDYQGSTTGFGPNPLKTSFSAAGLSDFVLVNGRAAPAGTYTAGVINDNAGTADYHIEHARSQAVSLRPGVEWNGPYSSSGNNIVDVYEVFLNPGDYGINLDQTSGEVAFGMALYNGNQAVFSKHDYLPGAITQWIVPGDNSISASITTAGYYALVVFKHDWFGVGKAASYRLAVSPRDIYLLSPNGGETFGLGETCQITWDNFGDTGDHVNIQISRDGGLSYSTIASNVPNTGVYSWVISGKVSYYARMRVVSTTLGSCGDVSDSTFSIISRSLDIQYPNGGETWAHGSSNTITWTSSDVPGDVKLEISRNSGNTWETIAAVTPNDGSYSWTATLPASAMCRLRVTAVDHPTCSDISDSNFSIVGPQMLVTYPDGGETWMNGETRAISWTSQNLTGLIAVKLSRNGGTSWETLTSTAPATGSFEYTVSGATSTACLVKVNSNAYPTAADVSNAPFSILSRSIQLIEPTTETWQIGSNYTVRWTGENLAGLIKIELSHDNKATWTTLTETANTAPTGGLATVTATGPPSTQCHVRVSCVDAPTVSDTNDSYFRISGRWIGMDSPNGGETWFSGETRPVFWYTSGISGLCGIELSTDSGATWQALVGNWPVSNCLWTWHIGDIDSTHCRLRITSYEYPDTFAESAADFTIARRQIDVTAPVGGEQWCIGSNREIRWTSSNVDGNVSIRLLEAGSGHVDTIVSGTPNDGSHIWPVTLMPASTYTVQIVSDSYSGVVGSSVGTIAITDSAFTILAPNGGETFTAGTSITVAWESCNVPAGNVNIEISRDGGATWTTAVADTPNDGSESWSSTAPSSTQCRFRISLVADPGFLDISDTDFSIVTRSLRVITPNGGEVWETGTTRTLEWQRANCPGNIRIDISRNAGLTWSTIFASTDASSRYSWTVTSPTSSNCRIRVTSLDYPTVSDSSNSSFRITDRGITVVDPVPDAVLTEGEPAAITWISRNLPAGDVKIELSRDAGSSWTTLYASAPDTGSAVWTATLPASTRCLIRITSLADTAIGDSTDRTFAITTRAISVTSPLGGEAWPVGEDRLISWQSDNVDGSLRMELTRDNWQTSEVLKAEVDPTDQYWWTVTGPESANCRIRLTSNLYPSVSGQSADVFGIGEPTAVPVSVTLEDWVPGPVGKQITVSILDVSTGDELESHEVVLDAAGGGFLNTILTGTRDLRFSATHWLSRVAEDVLISSSMAPVEVSLRNGDCNADNSVGELDFQIVRSDWASSPPADPDADVNGDSSIDALDLAIIHKNWGQKVSSNSVNASGLAMWLGDAAGKELDTIERAVGEPFDIYIWASTTVPTWFIDAAVGFDTTTTSGPSAVPSARKIRLAHADPEDDLVWVDALGSYKYDICNRLSGFYSSAGGVRQYGADFACCFMDADVPPFTSLALARLTLMHAMEPGDTALVRLWDDGSGTAKAMNTMSAGTSFIYGVSDIVQIVSYIADTIVEAKSSPDRDRVAIRHACVSAATDDIFYIVEDNRSMGIQVHKTAHGVEAGMRVDVFGTLATDTSGERCIEAEALDISGSCSVRPLAITHRNLGGGNWLYNEYTGAGQRGVHGGAGANTVGLPVVIVGTVTYAETGFFYVDDGSGCSDGSGYRGVRIAIPGLKPPPEDSLVRITGISSLYISGGQFHRLVKVTDERDVEPVP